MKGADNMGQSGSPNTGKVKYHNQGSAGTRGTSSAAPMPRAQQTESGKGVRKLKRFVPTESSKGY